MMTEPNNEISDRNVYLTRNFARLIRQANLQPKDALCILGGAYLYLGKGKAADRLWDLHDIFFKER